MVEWEFYLQKKGDRAWLNLETSSIEIGQGEYRLAVKCQYKQTLVTMRLRCKATGKTEEYDKWTNSQGLMLVMPFRELGLGVWQVECLIVPLNFCRHLQLSVVESISPHYFLQLPETQFTVSDQGLICLPIVVEGTGELSIVLQYPDTMQTILDVRRYLWQGGKLDLEIEMPLSPLVTPVIGTVRFGDQYRSITVAYPPRFPKINTAIPTAPEIDRLLQTSAVPEDRESAPMDAEFSQLLPQLLPQLTEPAPQRPNIFIFLPQEDPRFSGGMNCGRHLWFCIENLTEKVV